VRRTFTERMVGGAQTSEVEIYHITEAGQQALGNQR
jgi:DNA-binding PadR family transcriptional regulator